VADNTTLNAGVGGDVFVTEDLGNGTKVAVSKLYVGAHGVSGGPVTPTNPLPVIDSNTEPAFAAASALSIGGKLASVHRILGRRSAWVDTTSQHDMVEFASTLATEANLTGIESLEIVSSSANDTLAGTGVQSVVITYIDASGNQQTTTPVALNGVTPVALSFKALAIQWMEASATGSGGAAAGNIRVRIAGGGAEHEQISIGHDTSRSGRYMVPAGYHAHLVRWSGHAINADQDMQVRSTAFEHDRSLSTVLHGDASFYLPSNGSNAEPLDYITVPSLGRIKLTTIAASAGATVRADANFTFIVAQN